MTSYTTPPHSCPSSQEEKRRPIAFFGAGSNDVRPTSTQPPPPPVAQDDEEEGQNDNDDDDALNRDDGDNKAKAAALIRSKLAGGGGGGGFTGVIRGCVQNDKTKKIFTILLPLVMLIVVIDLFLSPEDQRLVQPKNFELFLEWVHAHPFKGMCAYIVVYGITVVLLLPGTPLTLGGGYVFKVIFGWTVGITVGSISSLLGSLLGSVSCFVLGRYLMKDTVRKWVRRYPLFDAIDHAVADHGFRIMALLYLTPVLPLGPVSYMCGTTSMALPAFAAAKIAALPLFTLYVIIGASAGTLAAESATKKNSQSNSDSKEADSLLVDAGQASAEEALQGLDLAEWTEAAGNNLALIVGGIVLSIVTIALISHYVKKELYKIFDEQSFKKDSEKSTDVPPNDSGGLVSSGRDATTHRRRPPASGASVGGGGNTVGLGDDSRAGSGGSDHVSSVTSVRAI